MFSTSRGSKKRKKAMIRELKNPKMYVTILLTFSLIYAFEQQ